VKLFCLLALLSFPVWAQLKIEQKIEKDLPAMEDPQIRRNLLFAGALKSLGHFSSELGMNVDEFQKKLSEKFINHFDAFKLAKLEEKFGKNHQTSLTPEEKQKFLASLEVYRDQELINFTHVENLIQSYTFKTLKQDEKTPGRWMADIELTMDKVKLDRFIKRITSDVKKPYSKIWLIPSFNLQNASWTDLGLERESLFTNPIAQSWEKWIGENLSPEVEDVGLCLRECLAFYQTWENRDSSASLGSAQSEYAHGVFLRLSVDLRRVSYKESSQESLFEFSGRSVLTDIPSKRQIKAVELSTEKKQWRGIDLKATSSALANAIYRSGLSPLGTAMKGLEQEKRLDRVDRLVIKGYKSMSDVLALVKLLEGKGAQLGLKTKIDGFNQNQAELLCFYQGEEKSFTDVLSSLHELKSAHSYKLVSEHTGVHHVLRLVND
jgi:hypothetical protein